jgi:2-dehydropantoate 2-reductase
MEKKNITIIGLGGVGGYFGFKINKHNEQSQENEISFVVRNETYQAIKERGLILLSKEFTDNTTKPNHILQSISEISYPDLVFVCVKEYDLENVCLQLLPVTKPETILFPLMNGADIYERMRKIIPHHTIIPSCVYISAHIKDKGIIEHKSNPGKIIFGKDKLNPEKSIEWIGNLFKKSNIDFDFQENPEKAIWTKFMFIASFGLVTSKHNSSFGAVCKELEQKNEAIDIMKEINAIALKKGIMLDKAVIENTFTTAMTFPYDTPSSMQLDIHIKKRGSELDLLGGSIVQFGKELNIETPITYRIYNELKSITNKSNHHE